MRVPLLVCDSNVVRCLDLNQTASLVEAVLLLIADHAGEVKAGFVNDELCQIVIL